LGTGRHLPPHALSMSGHPHAAALLALPREEDLLEGLLNLLDLNSSVLCHQPTMRAISCMCARMLSGPMPGQWIGQGCWVLAGICRHKRCLSVSAEMHARLLALLCGEDSLEGLLSLLDLSSDMRMNNLIHGAAKLYVGRTQCRGFPAFWI